MCHNSQYLSQLSVDAATTSLLFLRNMWSNSMWDAQDLRQLSIDAVQPYMLPWDVRKLLKCLNSLLAPKPACYGYHEPSLFCSNRAIVPPLPEGPPPHTHLIK